MSEEPGDEQPSDADDDASSDGSPDRPDRSGRSHRGGTPGSDSTEDSDATGAGESGGASDASTDTASTAAVGDGGTMDGRVSTPPDDEELPLTEHIEEMLSRLSVVVVIATFATLAVFPLAGDAIVQIWYDVHPGTLEACKAAPRPDECKPPHLYNPFELVLMRIRVAGLVGLLVALPLAVYQTYRFMRPGLYPHERRYYLASVPFSLVLGVVGMMFSYFVILPLLFTYFITYTEGSAEAQFALTDTMNLVLIMLGMMAVIFQIPMLIMLAIMMGLTTRRWLERRRIYFWGLFLGIAFLFGPDPTGMAPILLTATMIVLFEASLLLLRWTGR